jgi:hypothetical protein
MTFCDDMLEPETILPRTEDTVDKDSVGHAKNEGLELHMQPSAVSQPTVNVATNDDDGSTISTIPKRKRCPFDHSLPESFYYIENTNDIGCSLVDAPCNGCSRKYGEGGIILSTTMKVYK